MIDVEELQKLYQNKDLRNVGKSPMWTCGHEQVKKDFSVKNQEQEQGPSGSWSVTRGSMLTNVGGEKGIKIFLGCYR